MLFSEQNHTFLCASTVFQMFKNSPTIMLHFQIRFLVTWLMCGPFSERDNGLHQTVETFLHISVGFIMLKRADVRSVWWGQHSGKAYVGS